MVVFAVVSVFCFAYALAVLKLPLIIAFCERHRLYDESDCHRKEHVYGISRLGGLSFFSSFTLTLLCSIDMVSSEIWALTCASTLIFIVGLRDDLVGGLRPMRKFTLQFAVSAILVLWGGYGLEFGTRMTIYLFITLLVINAFNLIDGLNGLAGAIGLLVNCLFGLLFLREGYTSWSLISFAFAGAVCGFLKYNYHGRIFMGDSGAMLIGIISAGSALKLISINSPVSEDPIIWSTSAFGLCLSVMVVPIFDTFRLFVIRILHGRSPFVGDRNHIHHRLKFLGMDDKKIVWVLVCFSIWMILIGLFLSAGGSLFVMTATFVTCMLINTLITYRIGKRFDKGYRLKDVLMKDTFRCK